LIVKRYSIPYQDGLCCNTAILKIFEPEVKATRPVLEIFKMAGYFWDSPRTYVVSFTVGFIVELFEGRGLLASRNATEI
jgi:hypothetical protein